METLNDLNNDGIAPRFQLKVRWRLDLDKHQRSLVVLDNESNREVDGFSRVRNGPLGTDIIAFSRGKNILLWVAVAAATKTKD